MISGTIFLSTLSYKSLIIPDMRKNNSMSTKEEGKVVDGKRVRTVNKPQFQFFLTPSLFLPVLFEKRTQESSAYTANLQCTWDFTKVSSHGDTKDILFDNTRGLGV